MCGGGDIAMTVLNEGSRVRPRKCWVMEMWVSILHHGHRDTNFIRDSTTKIQQRWDRPSASRSTPLLHAYDISFLLFPGMLGGKTKERRDYKGGIRVSQRQCNTGDTVVRDMSELSGLGPGSKNQVNRVAPGGTFYKKNSSLYLI